MQRGEKNSEAGKFLCGLPRDAYFMVCYTKSLRDGSGIAALGSVAAREPDEESSNLFRHVAFTRLKGSVR